MDKRYLTVSALTEYIKHRLDQDPHLKDVYVSGEISEVYVHQFSGHMYLTLKDERAQLKAVMFRSDNLSLNFTPEAGMSVIVQGYVSVYQKSGQYQLYIKKMEPSGIGALYLAFEQLKEKLQKAGYFNEEHKKPIPKFPKKIAVITSPEGAAVQDIIVTTKKRYPIVELVILPVSVQGQHSVPSIVRAIEQANRHDFDTIILARGGGSIEDLASFNDERVAMAVFHSKIPIITGIGHETDTTIADLVADLRAPTPTGAVQFAVPSLEELRRQMKAYENELFRLSKLQLMRKAEKLERLKTSRAFHFPLQFIREKEQRIDQLSDQLANYVEHHLYKKQKTLELFAGRLKRKHPAEMISFFKQNVSLLDAKFQNICREQMTKKRHDLAVLIEKLSLLNPLEIMKRGYTITYSEKNKLLKSITEVNKDDIIEVKMYDGSAICRVKEVKADDGTERGAEV